MAVPNHSLQSVWGGLLPGRGGGPQRALFPSPSPPPPLLPLPLLETGPGLPQSVPPSSPVLSALLPAPPKSPGSSSRALAIGGPHPSHCALSPRRGRSGYSLLPSRRPSAKGANTNRTPKPRPRESSACRLGGTPRSRAAPVTVGRCPQRSARQGRWLLAHPEDEVKSEQQVLDALGAPLDRHGASKTGLGRTAGSGRTEELAATL